MLTPKTQFHHDFVLLRGFDIQQQGLGLSISLGDVLENNEINMMPVSSNFFKFVFSLWEMENNVYLESTTALFLIDKMDF